MPGGGGGARTFSYGFNFSNPEDLFRDAFRDEKMGGGMGGMGGMGGLEDILFNAARGGAGSRRSTRTSFGGDNMRSARQATPEVTTVERPLPVSLEDLFNGTTKKMKIKRKTFDETGKRTTSDTVLEVPIKPGLKKGSKIRFKGVGDQEEGGQQDLVFIVEEVRIIFLPFSPTISFSQFMADLCSLETASTLHPRRQRHPPHCRLGSQGGIDRLEEDRHNDRRQES